MMGRLRSSLTQALGAARPGRGSWAWKSHLLLCWSYPTQVMNFVRTRYWRRMTWSGAGLSVPLMLRKEISSWALSYSNVNAEVWLISPPVIVKYISLLPSTSSLCAYHYFTMLSKIAWKKYNIRLWHTWQRELVPKAAKCCAGLIFACSRLAWSSKNILQTPQGSPNFTNQILSIHGIVKFLPVTDWVIEWHLTGLKTLPLWILQHQVTLNHDQPGKKRYLALLVSDITSLLFAMTKSLYSFVSPSFLLLSLANENWGFELRLL